MANDTDPSLIEPSLKRQNIPQDSDSHLANIQSNQVNFTIKVNNKTTTTSNAKTTLETSTNRFKITKPPQPKQLKFVNTNPGTILKPKTRMKPTFKINTQVTFQSKPQPTNSQTSSNNISSTTTVTTTNKRPKLPPNGKSIMIEQRFDLKNNVFVIANEKQYQFQEQVKRPPGRPRKHPIDTEKVKRPQGRPRKHPINVTGTTVDTDNDKDGSIDTLTMTVSPINRESIPNFANDNNNSNIDPNIESGFRSLDQSPDPSSLAEQNQNQGNVGL